MLRFLLFSVRSLSIYPVLGYVFAYALPCLICGDAFNVNKNDAILNSAARTWDVGPPTICRGIYHYMCRPACACTLSASAAFE